MTPVRSVCSGCGVGGLPLLLTTALHFAAPEMTSEGQSLGRKSMGRYRTYLPCSPLLFSAQFGSSLGLVCATLPQKKEKISELSQSCVSVYNAQDSGPLIQGQWSPFQRQLRRVKWRMLHFRHSWRQLTQCVSGPFRGLTVIKSIW